MTYLPSQEENDSYTEGFVGDKSEDLKITLKDIIAQRTSGNSCSNILFLKYCCKMENERRKLIPESKIISSIVENVNKGVDPRTYAERNVAQWSGYSTQKQLGDLVEGLNPRGVREFKLKTKLQKMKDRIESKIDSCLLFKSAEETKAPRSKPQKGDIVDKTLFRTMEDFLEANLRDQLLDLEERLWQASLGIIKVENRDKWRDNIASKINDLLMGKTIDGPGKAVKEEIAEEIVEDGGVELLENGISPYRRGGHTNMEVDNNTERELSQDESMNSDLDMNEEKDPTILLKKSLPLKLIDHTIMKEEESRCNTPVNVSTPLINPNVRLLALVLLEVF